MLTVPLLRPKGLEPLTPGSEDRCSIQLSYGRARAQEISAISWARPSFALRNIGMDLCFGFTDCRQALYLVHGFIGRLPKANSNERKAFNTRFVTCVREAHERESHEEERRDSNPRPPGPQPGALTDCATLPMFFWHAREDSNLRPAA